MVGVVLSTAFSTWPHSARENFQNRRDFEGSTNFQLSCKWGGDSVISYFALPPFSSWDHTERFNFLQKIPDDTNLATTGYANTGNYARKESSLR